MELHKCNRNTTHNKTKQNKMKKLKQKIKFKFNNIQCNVWCVRTACRAFCTTANRPILAPSLKHTTIPSRKKINKGKEKMKKGKKEKEKNQIAEKEKMACNKK
jgi:hypothetical protein